MAPPSFVQRMLMSKVLGELVEFLPEPARDALVDLRDYVHKHGKLPKFEPLRREPVASGENVQAVSVLMSDLPQSAIVRMVNLLKGNVRGGSLRGFNVVMGELSGGELRGGNLVLGDVRGGSLRGLNLLVGDLHQGEARAVNAMIGDVHGGELKCMLLVGDVHGGKVRAKLMLGQVHGGDVQVERTL